MTDRSPYALLVVQIAVARFVGVNPGAIVARQRLESDLRLDAFDVALIATAIGGQLEIELTLEEVDDAATVEALAGCVARALRQKDGQVASGSAA